MMCKMGADSDAVITIHKVKIPYSYIDMLKQQNGGYIKFNAHPSDVPISWADDHVNVEHILGIGMVTALS